MKSGMLILTFLLMLLGINASTESNSSGCADCISLDTLIPKDTLERIKRDAVREATDSMMAKVQVLIQRRDSLEKVIDSMRDRPERVLGHVDTVRGLHGTNVWRWWYWKSGKKYRRFSHLEIKRL